jgi:predicted small secreted protein
MNWKSFVLGAGLGIAGGYLLKDIADKNTLHSPEKVLQHVKNAFKKEGPIDGSWIGMVPESYEVYPVKTKVYRGGISRHKDGALQQYEFVADSHTGTVLQVQQLS